ncbi:MAG: MBL fold metallo-hydrolase [Lachnospiraceae bacterium]|nr:MBL fold metallo-hydrolase [Lachnospiraceae bacterium]
MRLCSIASGSSGNCIYIGEKNTHVLVDTGISAKRIEEGLRSISVLPEELSAIFITHEHTDHVQGLWAFEKKHKVPVYATERTLDAYMNSKKEPGFLAERLCVVTYDKEITVGDFRVRPFRISHDAVRPVSYTFCGEKEKIGVATDLGCFDEYTMDALKGCGLLYLESNHDENMLLVGKYPYALKQRVLGRMGHLSNDAAAELAGMLVHEGLKYIVLGHLSKENNYPELAYETMRQKILSMWKYPQSAPEISVANRESPSAMLHLDA